MARARVSELVCARCEHKGRERCPAEERNWRDRRTPEARRLYRQMLRMRYCEKWGPIWDEEWT